MCRVLWRCGCGIWVQRELLGSACSHKSGPEISTIEDVCVGCMVGCGLLYADDNGGRMKSSEEKGVWGGRPVAASL